MMASSDRSPPDETDVLIVCALKDEYDAVVAVNAGLAGKGWDERASVDGWLASFATFHAVSGGAFRVCATFGAQMGREHNQAVASVFANAYRPRLIGMTGICAGRRSKVNLGDVIFAERVWSYDAGKVNVDADGAPHFQGDPIVYSPPDVWVQRLRAYRPASGDWERLRPVLPLEWQEEWVLRALAEGQDPRNDAGFAQWCADWPDVFDRLCRRDYVDPALALTEAGNAFIDELRLRHPTQSPAARGYAVHVAPMATGAAVQEDPEVFDRIAPAMRKVLGLDMEASAIGALARSLAVPFIVVKGVSDCGDPLKDDRYRQFAARASAECFLDFLRRAGDLLPSAAGPAQVAPPRAQAARATVPGELVREFANLYPDRDSARALWERAGGVAYEVENIANPRDMWQRLWLNACRGARVSPAALLDAALEDFPHSEAFQAARASQK
ncbi:phosphorylase family protein [Paraburkholderia polaris]|nr:effector-associated domain EAD1-containing protein [Paraburkholderia polaris]